MNNYLNFTSLALITAVSLPAWGATAKTRYVKVVVKNNQNLPVEGASIVVVDMATKTPLEGQVYKTGADGSKGIVVRAKPDVELVIGFPGMVEERQVVYWSNQYEIRLSPPSQLATVQYSQPVTPVQNVVVVPTRQKRSVSIVVEGTDGRRLQDSEVAVLDARTKKIIERKLLLEGLGSVEFESEEDLVLELVATAPGRKSTALKLGSGNSYIFKLQQREVQANSSVVVKDTEGNPLAGAQVIVAEAGKILAQASSDAKGAAALNYAYTDEATLTIEAALDGYKAVRSPMNTRLVTTNLNLEPIIRTLDRTLSIIVQGSGGERLEQADVSVLNEQTSKLYERVLLPQGVGAVRFKANEKEQLKLQASAAGRVTASQPIGAADSYTFKLELKQLESKVAVTVKDNVGRMVSDATILVTEEGRQLASVTTDQRGWAEVGYAYSNASLILIETHHGGYMTRKAPLNPSRDNAVEIVLMPQRREVKPSMYAVLVLSKVFTSSAQTLAHVRMTMKQIMDDCQKNPELWKGASVLTIGDGRIRQILAMSEKITEDDVKQALTRLSGLYAQAGSLSWRDLQKLAEFIKNSRQVGEAGAEVLVIAPKNPAIDETLNLYDAGGDGVMDAFRQNNLRLRLVEVGFTKDPTRSYKELCDKTQGFYKALTINDKLFEEVAKLQFHYPTPPPQN
ncbi:MAG: carboxypeptidase-like regulatory domain-containing protein [Planctomycetota bacterium]|nr:carboxypeptidase-like regulatory domain-containing protein [Planctomycetota bacterium]MDA1142522.1 carboxypeptidase-like regulatory domain-containing protein [Planctomycetota bacterium]